MSDAFARAAPVLSVDGCSFAYRTGDFHLLDVSLDVLPGQVLGVVGPNGSGKSTLLRLMGGQLRPAPGRVTLGGRPVGSLGARRLAREVAFLPQDPATSFRFAVREVVAMGRYPYLGAFGFLTEHDVGVVEEAMRETETDGLADRSFATLSGGEKQRALVAGILAQEPSVMLLDEPTAALDIHHAAEVMDLLWGLARRGLAVVLVTHDLNAAGQFCHRLALMSRGRLAHVGPPADVMAEAQLSEAYGADVRVVENPLTGTPMAIVPGRVRHRD